MDLHEDPETHKMSATFEFPGFKKEDINISVNNGRLTVSGESKTSSEKDEHGYAVRERKFGQFSRTLALPQGLKVSSRYCSRAPIFWCWQDIDRMRISKLPWRMVSWRSRSRRDLPLRLQGLSLLTKGEIERQSCYATKSYQNCIYTCYAFFRPSCSFMHPIYYLVN